MSAIATPAARAPAWIVSAAIPANATKASREIIANTRLMNAKGTTPASMECAPMAEPTIFVLANRNTVAKTVR